VTLFFRTSQVPQPGQARTSQARQSCQATADARFSACASVGYCIRAQITRFCANQRSRRDEELPAQIGGSVRVIADL